jgi:hypothetical protein
MDRKLELYFRDELRNARSSALLDSEAFAAIILVLERIGTHCLTKNNKKKNGLAEVKPVLEQILDDSPLKKAAYQSHQYHVRFSRLFDLINWGRNTAVHEGALARHLTRHAIELALLVEDGLMKNADHVSDFMVRGAITASPWHPLSFIRQSMLLNSFSYLPVFMQGYKGKDWWLVADFIIAGYLRASKNNIDRTERLCHSLEYVVNKGLISLIHAEPRNAKSPISSVLYKGNGEPTLVIGEHNELLGILTPFDLL